jgi:tRNA threonylcarbamoyl adenosine modification protein (Sua5/YciO/YrdC/YwlC family)
VAAQVIFDQSNPTEHVALAAKSLRDGFVIVAPHENGYVFLADAFSPDSVRAMHVLRGDNLGVACQVLIADQSAIEGLSRDVTDDIRALAQSFWPGPLSLTLRPQLGLSWDLGDGGNLDWFSVRAPRHLFLQKLLKETGPLASASAALAGHPPLVDLEGLKLLGHEIALLVADGVIDPTPASTVIEIDKSEARLLREGAISKSEIEKVIRAPLITSG